jgi:hypothetical protein
MFYLWFENLLEMQGISLSCLDLPLGYTASTAILWIYWQTILIYKVMK